MAYIYIIFSLSVHFLKAGAYNPKNIQLFLMRYSNPLLKASHITYPMYSDLGLSLMEHAMHNSKSEALIECVF